MSNPDAIWSADHVRHYVSPASDVDCIAESNVNNVATGLAETNGSPCRAIRSKNGGTIVIVTDRGEVCDCQFTAGETRVIRAKKIYAAASGPQNLQRGGTAATTETDFEVHW